MSDDDQVDVEAVTAELLRALDDEDEAIASLLDELAAEEQDLLRSALQDRPPAAPGRPLRRPGRSGWLRPTRRRWRR